MDLNNQQFYISHSHYHCIAFAPFITLGVRTLNMAKHFVYRQVTELEFTLCIYTILSTYN